MKPTSCLKVKLVNKAWYLHLATPIKTSFKPVSPRKFKFDGLGFVGKKGEWIKKMLKNR